MSLWNSLVAVGWLVTALSIPGCATGGRDTGSVVVPPDSVTVAPPTIPANSPGAPGATPPVEPPVESPTVFPALPGVGSLAAGAVLTSEHLADDAAAPYFVVEPISDAVFARMGGRSWREGALSTDQLRYLRTLYVGFDGATYVGEIIVNETVADSVLSIFRELYDAEYPIDLMVLIDNFDADDTASMTANNTSGYNHRYIAGTHTLSNHAKGLAIDLNPVQNPWVSGNSVEPANGRPYMDRTDLQPHMINHDDLAYQLFREHGFTWGGDWRTPRDYQHFEKNKTRVQ